MDAKLEMQQSYLGPRLFAYPGMREWWNHNDGAAFGPSTNQWLADQIEQNRDTATFWDASAAPASP